MWWELLCDQLNVSNTFFFFLINSLMCTFCVPCTQRPLDGSEEARSEAGCSLVSCDVTQNECADIKIDDSEFSALHVTI